jgi:hypothetical protein
MKKNLKIQKAVQGLAYILPLLKKYKFKWCISGSLACYLYGVKRSIGGIDFDIETTHDDPKFKMFLEEVRDFTKLPFQLWIDKNYDNWVTDIVVNGQYLSVCTTAELKMFNKKTGQYELFYKNGIPNPVLVEFEGLQLPLAPIESVLKMRQALAYKKGVIEKDIKSLQRIIDNQSRT